MSRQKPYTYEQVWNPHAACWDLDKTKPLYRRPPTHKEEQAVVRAAVKWATTAVEHYTPRDRPMPPKHAAIVTAVDRLLAKRKARR